MSSDFDTFEAFKTFEIRLARKILKSSLHRRLITGLHTLFQISNKITKKATRFKRHPTRLRRQREFKYYKGMAGHETKIQFKNLCLSPRILYALLVSVCRRDIGFFFHRYLFNCLSPSRPYSIPYRPVL